MSWLFGIYGKRDSSIEKQFAKNNPYFTFETENLLILTGGLRENIFFEKIDEDSGWIVCGIGIQNEQSIPHFMDSIDWKKLLSVNARCDNELDGHFIVAKWNKYKLQFFNDKLGIRDLFFLQEKSFTSFSTRPDFFKYFNHNFEINFSQFSGDWNLSFPLSINSMFKEIKRLGHGGEAQILNGSVSIKNHPFNYILEQGNEPDAFVKKLKNITTFPLLNGKRITLGLSGGMDSRVLLEMLLNAGNHDWQTHSIGSSELPDVKIAQQISDAKNIKYQSLNNLLPSSDNCLIHLKDCISQTGPLIPASGNLFYKYYENLFEQGWIIIDGAHGEIHRRESLNKILYFSKNAIAEKDSDSLYKIFSRYKSNIFNQETTVLMEKMAINQISNLFANMPEASEIGLENWLDLLMIKYSLPNLTGPSQSLLDSIAVEYMPFIQYHLMELSFKMQVKEKKNSKLFKEILNKSRHDLNSYPLVKNSTYYPYNAGSFTKRLILRAKRKMNYYYKDNSDVLLLDNMKDFAFDTINSISFNNYEYYDQKKISKNVEEYYAGNKSISGYLDWWLAFEIWRSIYFEK
jgi:asparagine synthetase B (glutamine-hydrolysing)